VLVTEVDGGSMDAGADDSDDDSGSMEENLDNDDLQIGMPLYGSTMGDVDPEPQAPTGTHGNSQAPTHGHPPQAPMDGAMVKSREEPWISHGQSWSMSHGRSHG
jgi:GH18 family chitinase